MKVFSDIKKKISSVLSCKPTIEEAEVSILGIKAKIFHTTCLPVPNEVSLYIPRLEITNKVTEGSKTTETSFVLNSLTIVSAPRHEPTSIDLKGQKTLL